MIYMLSEDPSDKQNVIDELKALTERDDGPKSINVYEPHEIYDGPKTELAPDLLFELDNFECAVDPRPTTKNDVFSIGSPSEARNGGHNRDGILMATGPDLTSGDDLAASIYDIAPTLLYLHDVPIPEEADGEVLRGLIDDDRLDQQETITGPIRDLTDSSSSSSREDEQEVQERLEDLGYI
jgi:predicted AlkP superfamily phosphohydrolase/phosphomutase